MPNRFSRVPLRVLCAAILAACCSGDAADGGNSAALIAVSTTAPVLDGSADDPCWDSAPVSSDFTVLGGDRKSAIRIEVKAVYDRQRVYFLFVCHEPQQNLVLKNTERDSEVWNDSSIELFLYPDYAAFYHRELPIERKYYHLALNANAVQFDQKGDKGADSWDGQNGWIKPFWKVKTEIHPDRWVAEVAVPVFMNVAYRYPVLHDMRTWRLQIGNTSYDEARNRERSTLFATSETYANDNGFGQLVFVGNTVPSSLERALDKVDVIDPHRAVYEEFSSLLDADDLPEGIPVEKLRELETTYDRLNRDADELPDSEYLERRSGLLAGFEQISAQVREFYLQVVRKQYENRGSGFAVLPHPPIKDKQIVTPDFIGDYKRFEAPLEVTLCVNEYEPASFVIRGHDELRDVYVEVSDLRSGDTVMAGADAIDIKWVKCWYQGSTYEVTHTGKVLTPELLLKNPDHAQVDYEKGENLYPFGRRQELDYPDDSRALVTIRSLPAGFAQQVWLSVNVPDATPPGTYTGTIRVQTSNRGSVEIPIRANVLGFELTDSMLVHGWYTSRGIFGDQSEQRAMAELRNMIEHGVNRVAIAERFETLAKAVERVEKSGLPIDPLYVQGDWELNTWSGMTEEAAYRKARKIMDTLAHLGIDGVYVYLPDEAKGERLKQSIPIARGIRRAGAKTWVACGKGYFPIAGEYIDSPVIGGTLAPKETVDRIHALGHEVYSYGNPQGGIERPEIYRRNFGLLLWRADYDGAMDWAWWWSFVDEEYQPYRDPWDDFDTQHWRDHCMVYPTVSGVVDTIQAKGWREGVDDCRYLATLMDAIATARKAGRAEQADRAQKWLDDFKAGGGLSLDDLDAVRSAMIDLIEDCS